MVTTRHPNQTNPRRTSMFMMNRGCEIMKNVAKAIDPTANHPASKVRTTNQVGCSELPRRAFGIHHLNCAIARQRHSFVNNTLQRCANKQTQAIDTLTNSLNPGEILDCVSVALIMPKNKFINVLATPKSQEKLGSDQLKGSIPAPDNKSC